MGRAQGGQGRGTVAERVSRWLERAPSPVFVAYASVASFATYFCMYAFRKPFAAASFEGETFFGSALTLKSAFVIAQVVGYALSKYLGIKYVSEVRHRARALLALIGAAEVALLLFGVLPGSWKFLAIFCNGLPLGMVWGVVVRYLEGRTTSELLLAGLSASFIVASGVVKDVGRWLMAAFGVSEAWMPFATGALFLAPFAASVWLLDRLPPPTATDVAQRVERRPMRGAERRALLRRHLGGLLPLLVVYFFLTAYRDFRDNYGVELVSALGHGGDPAIFGRTELPVAVGVLVTLALLYRVADNRLALAATYGIMVVGSLLLVGAELLFGAGVIGGVAWFSLTGLGSYLTYVPFGSILFDRLVAATGVRGTAVFGIYLADALGYTGSVGVQLTKDLWAPELTRLGFFHSFSWLQGGGGAALLAASGLYFWRHTRR